MTLWKPFESKEACQDYCNPEAYDPICAQNEDGNQQTFRSPCFMNYENCNFGSSKFVVVCYIILFLLKKYIIRPVASAGL